MIWTRTISRNCKMTFVIGRGFAEHQILKKWKWPYLLNWVEYFAKPLRKHWYWQDLAKEIAKWHFSSIEALPSSKFWKSDNDAISWTEWNIVMKFCVHIDIDKMYSIRMSSDIWDWPRFKFWKKGDFCNMTFIIGWGFAERQILKKWKWLYSLNIVIDFFVNIDIHKI